MSWKNKRLVIIDGNSLINRAYYAIRQPMITKDGLYTHAVYGFLNMLQKIVKEHDPSHIVVAFDMKGPTFRHIEYKEYKADRKGMPEELAMQLPVLKEILEAMHIKILEIDGFEADDILGTVAKRGEASDFNILIITGDKDALQLASETTKILITKKGISEFELYDLETIIEKYGFTPDQFIDYKGLMGDPSDNIPGIPGVGEVTAGKLIHEFGSIENLIANADSIVSKKLRQKITDNTTLALMSRRLATIQTDVPIETDFNDFAVEEPDYKKLIDLYKRLEFNSFLRKMKLAQTVSPVPEMHPTISRQKKYIGEKENADDLKEIFKDSRDVCMKIISDNNHKNMPEIFGAAFMTKNCHCYIDGSLIDAIKSLMQFFYDTKTTIYGHNIQQDYYVLRSMGQKKLPKVSFDSAIAQYLIQPERSSYDIKPLLLEYFHKDFESLEAYSTNNGQLGIFDGIRIRYDEYGASWCEAAEMLRPVINSRLKSEGLISVFEDIELPLIPVLASMEARGFAIDRQELESADKSLSIQLGLLTQKIYELAGCEFNINSPKQLGEVLFEKLALPVGKKTKTGYSTNAEVLENLKEHHEIIDLILEYRTISKLKGTYVDGLLPLIHMDERIHAHFRQTVTSTGRISCTEPNLQNIPVREEIGRNLRKAFIPQSDDYVLLGADYSQIELRILAHMSLDPSLTEAFNRGRDIHKTTASRVFEVPENLVTPQLRSSAKAVNFGVIYGMSSFGLSTELHITRKQAENYIREYFEKHRMVKLFLDEQINHAKQHGYVTTIMNRKRNIHEINASNYMVRQAGERLAMNSPIQGSAADIIKMAMILCHEELEEKELKSGLILQVHDELIIETHKSELEQVKELLERNMTSAVKLRVALTVDLNSGSNWYELN